MKIIYFSPHRRRLSNIAVVAATALPEAIVPIAVGLLIQHSGEKPRGFAANEGQGGSSDQSLRTLQEQADVVFRQPGPEKKMSVLGHNDVRPNVELVFVAGGVDGVNQPMPRPVPAQKSLPSKAGKRQRMGVTRVVVASARFAVWWHR
jgi:hypothetical protein